MSLMFVTLLSDHIVRLVVHSALKAVAGRESLDAGRMGWGCSKQMDVLYMEVPDSFNWPSLWLTWNL
jgi:hypothetical protein